MLEDQHMLACTCVGISMDKKSQRSPKVGELASSFIDILQHLHFHEGLDILCISQNKHSRGLF